jgi:hypothetical protein
VDNVTLQFSGFDGEVQTFEVYVSNENRVEYTEEFQIRIDKIFAFMGPISGLGTTATGTITNDDSATVTLSVDTSDSTKLEGTAGSPGNQKMKVALSNPVDESSNIYYSFNDDTATAANDYVAALGGVALGPLYSDSATFDVTFKGDARVEFIQEAFRMKLDAPSTPFSLPITVDTSEVIAFIEDDDRATLNVLPVAGVSESTDKVTVQVQLIGDMDEGFTVDLSTSNNTAAAGADFEAPQVPHRILPLREPTTKSKARKSTSTTIHSWKGK